MARAGADNGSRGVITGNSSASARRPAYPRSGHDLKAEISARALYEEAATHCHGVCDYVSRGLFEKLMHDEEEHIEFLETQLVAQLGVELYSQHRIGKLEGGG